MDMERAGGGRHNQVSSPRISKSATSLDIATVAAVQDASPCVTAKHAPVAGSHSRSVSFFARRYCQPAVWRHARTIGQDLGKSLWE
jgi:hypothetical protein